MSVLIALRDLASGLRRGDGLWFSRATQAIFVPHSRLPGRRVLWVAFGGVVDGRDESAEEEAAAGDATRPTTSTGLYLDEISSEGHRVQLARSRDAHFLALSSLGLAAFLHPQRWVSIWAPHLDSVPPTRVRLPRACARAVWTDAGDLLFFATPTPASPHASAAAAPVCRWTGARMLLAELASLRAAGDADGDEDDPEPEPDDPEPVSKAPRRQHQHQHQHHRDEDDVDNEQPM
jgi:hypothetical protein